MRLAFVNMSEIYVAMASAFGFSRSNNIFRAHMHVYVSDILIDSEVICNILYTKYDILYTTQTRSSNEGSRLLHCYARPHSALDSTLRKFVFNWRQYAASWISCRYAMRIDGSCRRIVKHAV